MCWSGRSCRCSRPPYAVSGKLETFPEHTMASEHGSLQGKTFVITGASSGLGRGVALKLGARGANVALFARRGDLLGEVAAQVRAAGGAAIAVAGDVTQVKDMEALT